jgi:hypothetical protein
VTIKSADYTIDGYTATLTGTGTNYELLINDSENDQYVLTNVTGNVELTVKYTAVEYTLTLDNTGLSSAAIKDSEGSAPLIASDANPKTKDVSFGDTVKVDATATTNKTLSVKFTKTDGGAEVDATTVNWDAENKTFTMPAYALTVTVSEEDTVYTVTLSGEHCTLVGAKTVKSGEDYTFNVVPDAGYTVKEIAVTGGTNATATNQSSSSQYKVANTGITGNLTITVTVEQAKYDVTFTISATNTTVLDSDGAAIATGGKVSDVAYGGSVTFQVAGTTNVTITTPSSTTGSTLKLEQDTTDTTKWTLSGIDQAVTITIANVTGG